MKYRALGSTGIQVSEISFGAGPVPGLMTGADCRRQCQAVERALELGINWFDTAASYGDGKSESNLGEALKSLERGAAAVHVATKVRLSGEQLARSSEAVKRSVQESLKRLQRSRITLIQLHNSVTLKRGDQPGSITPPDVFGPGGVLEAFEGLKADGVIGHFGLTGMGNPKALREVVLAGSWSAIQVCESLLYSGGVDETRSAQSSRGEKCDLITWCAVRGVGVIAIRVLAGGALAGSPPSAHTRTTPYFPLPLYEQDQARAGKLAAALPAEMPLKEAAVRFVLGNLKISTALVGISNPEEIDELCRYSGAGPLDPETINTLLHALATT